MLQRKMAFTTISSFTCTTQRCHHFSIWQKFIVAANVEVRKKEKHCSMLVADTEDSRIECSHHVQAHNIQYDD